jgi:hypothetical protein
VDHLPKQLGVDFWVTLQHYFLQATLLVGQAGHLILLFIHAGHNNVPLLL